MSTKDIRLTRAVNVTVDGTTHELNAGWQNVDKAVADHWMVKAVTDNHSSDAQPDTRDAQIMELASQNSNLTARVAAAEAAAKNAVATQAALDEANLNLGTMTSARDNLATEGNQLREKMGTMQAELDALRGAAAASKAATATTPEQNAAGKTQATTVKRGQ